MEHKNGEVFGLRFVGSAQGFAKWVDTLAEEYDDGQGRRFDILDEELQ